MIGPDETTLVTCPVCHGQGEQRWERDTAKGYSTIVQTCFLCGGKGAVNAETIMLWRDAGCPQVRGDGQ